ncbi:hypothetical protein HF847_01130 [Clostridium cochlearium]|uniref:cell wall-binding repeat-containing protein n=1 Tax=Clostridium cochlearium TaxID=1494 RepID=UPI0014597B65|nr:cell wall-binding repeat-containing protein [Clostridium cochlearium]NME94611.1 hypothetical protein [Clostridium cochlearium]
MNKMRLNKKIASIVISMTIAFNMFIPINVQALGKFDIKSSFISKEIDNKRLEIVPGVTEKSYNFIDKDGKKQYVSLIEVKWTSSKVGIKAGTPNNKDSYGMQSVIMQAKAAITSGNNVVGAVNGDFYYTVTGEPIGIVYKNGKAIKSNPAPEWNFFGVLQDGTPIIGDMKKYNEVKESLQEALGGNAILVKDGKTYQTPNVGANREPRTAVGIKKDGTIFFITVDGRQEGYSSGISMPNLAQLMIDLGAVQALNLDGGGSTTFVSRKLGSEDLILKNRPSGGTMRSVGNSWLIINKEESDGIVSLAHIEPFHKTFKEGTKIQFKATGVDKGGKIISLPQGSIDWRLSDNSYGTIDNTGNFESNGKIGQFQVQASYNDIIIGSTWVGIVKPVEDSKFTIENKTRISGKNRFETAASIAKSMYKNGCGNVIIANGYNYTDQISASILGSNLKAPVLLVGNNEKQDKEALDYIKKYMNKDGKVFIVGGNGAVREEFVSKLKLLEIKNIDRMDGKNRYETNIKTNDKLSIKKGSPIIIASGEGFADSLSIVSIAQMKNYPIILTSKNSLSKDAENYIRNISPSKVHIVGGEGVVSKEVENRLSKLTGLNKDNIIRLQGANRYDTNLSVLKYFDTIGDTLAIASGITFPDSLVGSVYASSKNAPILLVNNDMDLVEQNKYIDLKKYKNCIIFGGTGVVKDSIFKN